MTITLPSWPHHHQTEFSIVSPVIIATHIDKYPLMTVPRSGYEPQANSGVTKPSPQSRPTSPPRPIVPAHERPRSLQIPLTTSAITIHHPKPRTVPFHIPSFEADVRTPEPPPSTTSLQFGMPYHQPLIELAAIPFSVHPSVLEGQMHVQTPSDPSTQGHSGPPVQNAYTHFELSQYSHLDFYRLGDPVNYEPLSAQVPRSAASESWSPMQPQVPLPPAYFAPEFRRQSVEMPRLRTAMACERCRVRKAKCSGDTPKCQRCISKGYDCRYVPTDAKNKGRRRRNTCSGAEELSLPGAARTVRTLSDDTDRSRRDVHSPASDVDRRTRHMRIGSHQQEFTNAGPSTQPSPPCLALPLSAVPLAPSSSDVTTPVSCISPSEAPAPLPTLRQGAACSLPYSSDDHAPTLQSHAASIKRRPPPLELGLLSNYACRSIGAGTSPIAPLFSALGLASPEYADQDQLQELYALHLPPSYHQSLPDVAPMVWSQTSTRPPSLIFPQRDPGWTDTPLSAGPGPSPFGEWSSKTAQQGHSLHYMQAMGPGPQGTMATLEAFNALDAAAQLGISCQWSQVQDCTPHF